MAGYSSTLCLHVSQIVFFSVFVALSSQTLNLIINTNSWHFSKQYYFFSGFDEIMPPHRIRAVLGLHAISEFKNKNTDHDNTIDGPLESAYEIEFRNIVVHPKYECKRPDNDIGIDNFCFLFEKKDKNNRMTC